MTRSSAIAQRTFAFAEAIHRQLVDAGFSVWFDRVRRRPGCDWHAEIREHCENSRVVLPILTPRWKTSECTRFETYGAEAVIPLRCEGEWDEVITPPLERFQGVAIMAAELWTRADRLFQALSRLLDRPTPSAQDRLFHLRYRPNSNFVGRDHDLIRIHEELHRKPESGLTQGRVRAITGMGGVGKTTLVRQYAEKFWRCYPQMFWVDCRKGIDNEFATLHDLLFPERTDIGLKTPDKARQTVRELHGDTTRLLIIDNAEEEEGTTDWIPKTGGCHTLITSRFSGWSAAVPTVRVRTMPKSDALELLQRRAQRTAQADELVACELRHSSRSVPLMLSMK